MTLRIEKSRNSELVVFTLMGRIQADSIPDLQQLLSLDTPDHPVVLDLREVRLVDRDVVQFLAQIEMAGVKLSHCALFVREWISQERARLQDTELGSNGQIREMR